MNKKQIKTHKCPTCGMIDECDIVVIFPEEKPRHSCRGCGSTWDAKTELVTSGGGEAK